MKTKNESYVPFNTYTTEYFSEKDFLTALYRLEIMKRNEKYREDYREFKKEEDVFWKQCCLDYIKKGGQPISLIFKGEIEFCKKWKIGTPFDPQEPVNDLLEGAKKDIEKNIDAQIKRLESDGRTLMGRKRFEYNTESFKLSSDKKYWGLSKREKEELIEMSTIKWFCGNLISKSLLGKIIDDSENYKFVGGNISYNSYDFTNKELMVEGTIKIKINLNYSKNIIKEEFQNVLNFWQSHYESQKKVNKIKGKEKEGCVFVWQTSGFRKELNKYPTYLEIWDMRSQLPKPTFREIGKAIYPKKSIKQAKELAIQNYYALYKLMYGEKYRPEKIKMEIKKEDLTEMCSKCLERKECKHLCPNVLEYVKQDEVKGGRELSLPKIEYTK